MSRRSRPATSSTRCRRAGVISVAERQAYIGRVRDLAKGACGAWMDAQGVCGVSADFLLELLSEEIPARMQAQGAQRSRADVRRSAGRRPGSATTGIDDLFDAAPAGADRARPAASDRGGQRGNEGPAHLGAAAGARGLPAQDRADAGPARGSRRHLVRDDRQAGPRDQRGAGRSGRGHRPRLPLAQVDALGRGIGVDRIAALGAAAASASSRCSARRSCRSRSTA